MVLDTLLSTGLLQLGMDLLATESINPKIQTGLPWHKGKKNA